MKDIYEKVQLLLKSSYWNIMYRYKIRMIIRLDISKDLDLDLVQLINLIS